VEKRVLGRVLLCGVAMFFLVVFAFGPNGLGTILSLKRSNRQLQINLNALKTKNKQLAFEISSWERYSFYKEQLAREQLQLSYSGDIIYYVV